jgi:hypothetical protein
MIKRFAKLKAGSKFLFPEPLLAGRRAEKAKEWLSLGVCYSIQLARA